MLIMLINVCVLLILLTVEISTETTLTWREAYNKCRENKAYLKSDISGDEFGPSTRFNMSVWIGSVEFLSKWLEIRGCYIMDDHTIGNVFDSKTIANCEIECQGFEFFAYKTGEVSVCKCMSKIPSNSTDAKNCEKQTYRFMIVYRRYSDSELFETKKENCMYMSCTPGTPNKIHGPYVVSCAMNKYIAHGVCANHEVIDSWGLGWNASLQKCIGKYGVYFVDNFDSDCSSVKAKSWTRIFRQQTSFFYDIDSSKDVLNNHQLVKCAAKRWNVKDNSWNKEYIDCNSALPFHFCKKDPVTNAQHASLATVNAGKEKTTEIRGHSSKSVLRSTISSALITQAINQSNGVTNAALTTPGIKENTDSSLFNKKNKSANKDKRLDVLIGTVVGGLTVVIALSIILLVCKIRSAGLFSKRKDHSVVEFLKERCEGSDQSTPMKKQPNVENKRTEPEILKTKDAYAQVIKPFKTENNMLYSKVNKTRKLSPGIQETDDNYSEFSEGEYDRLNIFNRRIIDKDSNMYDSNVGIRNFKDPTYDTTLHASRFEGEDVYDHSFPNVNTDSNYDCSSSLAHTNMRENDVYDKSV